MSVSSSSTCLNSTSEKVITAPSQTSPKTSKRLSFLLAFLSGYADHAFVTLFSTFPTMHTGSLMKLTRCLHDSSHGLVFDTAAFYAGMIVSYCSATLLYRFVVDRKPSRYSTPQIFAPLMLGFVVCDYAGLTKLLLVSSFLYGLINSISMKNVGIIR